MHNLCWLNIYLGIQFKDYLANTILGSKEINESKGRLRKKAHFEHNQEVLLNKKGTLLVERRENENENTGMSSDYRPCPECLGFYHHNGMRNHVNKCNQTKTSERSQGLLSDDVKTSSR